MICVLRGERGVDGVWEGGVWCGVGVEEDGWIGEDVGRRGDG